MPYSLVSAATLGFDLVRLPAGPAVAAVLLTGLAADEATLRRLAAAHPVATGTPAQRGRWAVRSRRVRELAAAGVPSLRATGPGLDPATRSAALVELLEQGTIGNAAALERVIRDDVLGPDSTAAAEAGPDVTALAADVLADGAVAAWAAAALPDRDRRALSAAVDRAGPPGPPDLGPSADGLHALVGRLRSADDADRARWRAAVDEVREGRRSWAAAMHGAAWAAHLSGRTRPLAAAQLLAVGGFVDAGFSPADGARGVWNAVAGCVQGLAVADLLDETSRELLSAPWVLVHGDWPPGGSAAAVPAQDHPHG